MAMSTRQLVTLLQKQGHQVTYYIRKDGGVLITSIDGTKFKGASGNKVARWMAGEQISQRRAQQLKTITQQRKIKPRKIQPTTPDNLEKIRKRVMRKWRKANLTGSISKRNLKRMIEDRGIEGAAKYLEEMERRSEGKAYFGSIDGLIARIEQDMVNADSNDQEALEELIKLINQYREIFKQEWIQPIVDKLYEWEQNQFSISARDVLITAKSLILG